MINVIEPIKSELRRLLGCTESKIIILPIDLSTEGNIEDAKMRAEYYGEWATVWLNNLALDYGTTDFDGIEKLAIADAKLAYKYATIAYNLEHERFAYLDEDESVSTTAQNNTPGETNGID